MELAEWVLVLAGKFDVEDIIYIAGEWDITLKSCRRLEDPFEGHVGNETVILLINKKNISRNFN